jgi:hypothetical protein
LEKRVELVSIAIVKEDEVLSMIMCKVIDQHKTMIIARRIIDEDKDNVGEPQLTEDVVKGILWSRVNFIRTSQCMSLYPGYLCV